MNDEGIIVLRRIGWLIVIYLVVRLMTGLLPTILRRIQLLSRSFTLILQLCEVWSAGGARHHRDDRHAYHLPPVWENLTEGRLSKAMAGLKIPISTTRIWRPQ